MNPRSGALRAGILDPVRPRLVDGTGTCRPRRVRGAVGRRFVRPTDSPFEAAAEEPSGCQTAAKAIDIAGDRPAEGPADPRLALLPRARWIRRELDREYPGRGEGSRPRLRRARKWRGPRGRGWRLIRRSQSGREPIQGSPSRVGHVLGSSSGPISCEATRAGAPRAQNSAMDTVVQESKQWILLGIPFS